MKKKRLIGKIIIKNGISVQSIQFKKYLPVGSPKIAAEYLNRWGVDEIILLDIDASKIGKGPNLKLIRDISNIIHTPLTVGGGIKRLDDVYSAIRAGADKVSINTSFFQNLNILDQTAKYFGSQSIVVSLDVSRDKRKNYKLFNKNIKNIKLTLFDAIKIAEETGAGELLISNIQNDGMKCGYDDFLFNSIKDKIKIPLIMSSGAGSIEHIIKAAKLNIDAIAVGNMLNFTEMSVILIKEILQRENINFRLETFANFRDNPFNRKIQRIANHSEQTLDKMRFKKIDEEII